MKTALKLRTSQFKDYVAVDIVSEDNQVIETPFYLAKNKTAQIKYKDDEDKKWYNSFVKIKDDYSCLIIEDETGFNWESPFNELLDINIVRFIN